MPKLVITKTYEIPNLEYFNEELEWNIESLGEVIDVVETWTPKELREIFGCPKETYKIEKD